jgi:hypothetical protein
LRQVRLTVSLPTAPPNRPQPRSIVTPRNPNLPAAPSNVGPTTTLGSLVQDADNGMPHTQH